MKRHLCFLLLVCALISVPLSAQEIRLKKGAIIDSIAVNDTIPESFSLYLPTYFEQNAPWPVLFVFELEGKAKQALHMFIEAAEEHGYILAGSNSVNDSLSLSTNVLIASRMFDAVSRLLPIHKSRVYTAGFSYGAKFAGTLPSFVSGIEGVISCGSPIPNTELLTNKRPFHFIGLVGKEDFNYIGMRNGSKTLNRLKFPNQLLVFEGGQEWPPKADISRALEIFNLAAAAKGVIERDKAKILESYKSQYEVLEGLIRNEKMLQAHNLILRMTSVYRPLFNLDSLGKKRANIRKDKKYRSQKRNENSVLLREVLIREDYQYYLEEDLLTYNFNNLGWWNYQMGKLEEYQKSQKPEEQKMGKRLQGYLNALIEDNIDILKREKVIDQEGLMFLRMLKTITAPNEYKYYLEIISESSRYEDYGTALFYLEELLKNGYKDREELYALEHTALFRISPEFNELVDKYLKEARYEIIEE